MTHPLTPGVEALLKAAVEIDGAIDAGSIHRLTIASAIRRGLMRSVPQAEGPSRLVITAAGRAAIGEAPPPFAPPEPSLPSVAVAPPSADQGTPKGKIAALIDLLHKDSGATLEVMMCATGWQAHSVRGALSGAIKKRRGLAVTSDKIDGVRRYRIAPAMGA